ncbi:MAG: 2-amino-4-hydroxy-6-hydroxymethyldihydropteridine diphosphokinase [Saccharospirillaceae bacterium]|nr:2-amino-4-hydroxy-6-hydroxymethyldihydropteridine diphosphokinase [Pseudomonadales bacterium]NRB80497.1 2-amino-4-hydroxy-6-hydroxymethyldihydropteridine diphosphokinase [Saccharospirillaceae bacterium]
MTRYIVSVGSNINPESNVKSAFEKIQLLDGAAKSASLLYTKAQGDTSQPDYINTAFLFHSNKDKYELKQCLLKIEHELGRVRTKNKNSARPIDLDISQIDDCIVDDDYQKYSFIKTCVDELNHHDSFNTLLVTIQKFELSIERQLKQLDVNYKQVLLLMNIKNKTMFLGDNDHAAIQYLIVKQWIVSNDNFYEITQSGLTLLDKAIKKLKSFENRLFINQKMQHSLLAQLNKLYGF